MSEMVRVFTSANRQVAAILVDIFVMDTKPIFKLGQEFDTNNPQ